MSREAGLECQRQAQVRTITHKALEAIPHGLPATVHSDSQYVVKGMTEWLPGWKKRGWRTGDKKPVKIQPLWERLKALGSERHVQWIWARGHAGHEQNERVDGLANAEARRAAEEMTL